MNKYIYFFGEMFNILLVYSFFISSRTLTFHKKILFVGFSESSLKMMKNPFYFVLKALFVLKIFKFLSSLFLRIEEMA